MLNNTESPIDNNETYWCNVFLLLNRNISKYAMGLIWIVGNIGSTMNCFIFLQSNLRKNPCVMYFLASSASQFLTFNFALLTRILQFGYNIQAVNIYLWFCKIRYYFFYVFVAIPRYYIILASIDRYFASSSDINRRRWSSPKIALRLIIGNILFWCLMYIQVLIFYENDNNDCSFRNGIYGMFFSIYIIIDSGIFPLAIMLICGLLTINNIRKIKGRIRPLRVVAVIQPVRLVRISRKDLQFSRMLLNQICIWIILNLINPCYLLYRTLTDNIIKSSLRLAIELFINNMSYFLIYLGFSLTFFVYTLSSSMFRREFYRLIQRKLLRHFI